MGRGDRVNAEADAFHTVARIEANQPVRRQRKSS